MIKNKLFCIKLKKRLCDNIQQCSQPSSTSADSTSFDTATWVIHGKSQVHLAHSSLPLWRHFLVCMCPCLHTCAAPLMSRHIQLQNWFVISHIKAAHTYIPTASPFRISAHACLSAKMFELEKMSDCDEEVIQNPVCERWMGDVRQQTPTQVVGF